jgi:hypothetical protein
MNTQIKSKVSEIEILIKEIKTIARESDDAYLIVGIGDGMLDIRCGIEKICHILEEE